MNLYKVTDRDARSGRALFLLHRCRPFPLYYRKILDTLITGWFLLGTKVVQAARNHLEADAPQTPLACDQLNWRGKDASSNITKTLSEKTAKDQSDRLAYFGPVAISNVILREFAKHR